MALPLVLLMVLVASAAQAQQWTVVNLHPAGASHSQANGVHAGQQVGTASVGGVARAVLWNGSAASCTDLHPAGAANSYGFGVHQGQQVGEVDGDQTRASLVERVGVVVGGPEFGGN